jgi:hypothetical protein
MKAGRRLHVLSFAEAKGSIIACEQAARDMLYLDEKGWALHACTERTRGCRS